MRKSRRVWRLLRLTGVRALVMQLAGPDEHARTVAG